MQLHPVFGVGAFRMQSHVCSHARSPATGACCGLCRNPPVRSSPSVHSSPPVHANPPVCFRTPACFYPAQPTGLHWPICLFTGPPRGPPRGHRHHMPHWLHDRFLALRLAALRLAALRLAALRLAALHLAALHLALLLLAWPADAAGKFHRQRMQPLRTRVRHLSQCRHRRRRRCGSLPQSSRLPGGAARRLRLMLFFNSFELCGPIRSSVAKWCGEIFGQHLRARAVGGGGGCGRHGGVVRSSESGADQCEKGRDAKYESGQKRAKIGRDSGREAEGVLPVRSSGGVASTIPKRRTASPSSRSESATYETSL